MKKDINEYVKSSIEDFNSDKLNARLINECGYGIAWVMDNVDLPPLVEATIKYIDSILSKLGGNNEPVYDEMVEYVLNNKDES